MIDIRGSNHLVATLITEELWRLGVRTFVLSPGSRSTPLAVALSRRMDSVVVHVDERGAGYFGFGAVLGGGAPVALVCTSGTAVANYLPAVVEASQSGVPLVIISADRPIELLDTGSNQTIRHRGIFSSYVRGEAEVVAPRDGGDAVRILRLVDDLFARATGVQPGPVHLNVAFRKPLLDQESTQELPKEVAEWLDSEKPLCLVKYGGSGFGRGEIADGARSRFAGLLKGGSAGLIMISGIDGARCNSAPLLAVAEKLKWPIIADVTSQLRLGVESPFLFSEASLIYEVAEARRILAPDRILHIGTQPVSHGLLELLSHCSRVAHCTLTGTRSDAVGNNRVSVSMLPDELLDWLDSEEVETYPSKLLGEFQRVRDLIRDKCDLVNSAIAGSELSAVEAILGEIPTEWQLYLANSLPIRLVDTTLCRIHYPIRVGYHRGASGIDGTVAAACGFAHAECTPTVAIIGDLAAIHDVNSLILAARSRAPVVLIIINNGGGGIFSTLPDIGNQECFEDFFITPQQVNFEGAAHFAGLPFERVDDEKAIAVAVKRAIQRRCASIVEVVTDWRKTAPAIAARSEIVADIIGAVSREVTAEG